MIPDTMGVPPGAPRLSARVPREMTPNDWELLRRRSAEGASFTDLSETNPSNVGLAFPGAMEILARAAERAGAYDPDPRGRRTAREAIARRASERGIALDPENVILTSGTSEGYAHALRLLADPGESVLVPRPSYPLVEPIAALEGVGLTSYDLAWEGRWRLDWESLERSVRPSTKAIFVVQPNNPTGSCFDDDEMKGVEEFAERRGLALVVDEVFGEFPRPPRKMPLPTFLGERRVPTFVLDGISKSCGLPGAKLAWIALAGPPAALVPFREGLAWIADLFLSVSTVSQLALPEWLDGRAAFQNRVHARLETNRVRLAALASRRPEIEVLPAEGGWSVVLRMPATRTDDDWAAALLARGVAAHPGHFYDFAEGVFLVFSLLPEPEVFSRGIDILEKMETADAS